MNLIIIILSTLVLTTTAEAKTQITRTTIHQHEIKKVSQIRKTGVASWYGYESVKRRKPITASGQPFNPRHLTAAHRTLPFGTKVKVTNMENKKSVVVTINDRGPFVKNRIIDLSKTAAKHIGIDGVQKVNLSVM